jgi:hypothetical protein
MPAQSNFQDVVVLNQDSLSVKGEQIILGTDAGSKAVVFSNNAFAQALGANPSANETIMLPDAGGTVGLITAISAGAALVSQGQVVFSNSNSISFGLNASTITASFSQTVQPGVTALGVSTGGNTLGNTGTTQGTVVFAALGNITLSQVTAANSLATITISGSQSTAPGAIAAGTQTATSGTVVFSNSNGLTFGMSGSLTVTATADYVRSISAGTTNATGNQIVFSNSNNISFGANGATITATVNVVGANAVSGIGVSTGGNTAGNTGTTFGTYVLAGAGGVSLSQSTAAGSLATVSISMTQSTAPGAIAAGTQTATSGTVVFSNSNSITFGMSNSSVITASFSQTVQPGVTAIGVSNVGNTAGNTGTTQGTYILAGAGGVTLSQSTAAGSLATVSISMTQSTAPGAIAAGTQTATSGTVVFSNSNGVVFGMSNSSVVTASVTAGGNSYSMTAFSQWAEWGTNWTLSNATMSMQKVSIPGYLSATAALVMLNLSGNTNSTGALTVSMGVYTMLHSTASLASSGSRQISWTSGTSTSVSSAYGGVSGTQYRTIGINLSLTPGDYLFAFNFSTTNNGTWQVFGRQGVNIVNVFDGIETAYFLDGTSGSSTGAFPSSIVATNTNYGRTGIAALRQPGVILLGTN